MAQDILNRNCTRVDTLASAIVDNGTSQIVLAATPNHRWQVMDVLIGYSAAPTTAQAKATIVFTQRGSTITYTHPKPTIGAEACLLPEHGIIGDVGTAITITLDASGAAANLGTVQVWFVGDLR